MTPQEFITNKLTHCSDYRLNDKDGALIAQGIEIFLYHQITRKKFRKWSIDEETQQHIRNALSKQVSKNEPIHFTFPFGAYKRWNLPSAPRVNWAEFFSLAYYSQYMAPIAAGYKPGCRFSFVGDDVIVPKLNNYPAEEVAHWSETFEQLLKAFHSYLPKNITIELLHVRDFYTPEEFDKELEEKYDQGKAEWDEWDDKTREAHLASSRHNIKWDGIEDWTGMPEKEKEEKILEAAIMHNVYRQLERRKAFTRAENRIAIFPHKISKAIPLGTTKNSAVYFWVGTGILEKRGDEYMERILSYEQWKDRSDLLQEVDIDVEGVPMKSIMIDVGKGR